MSRHDGLSWAHLKGFLGHLKPTGRKKLAPLTLHLSQPSALCKKGFVMMREDARRWVMAHDDARWATEYGQYRKKGRTDKMYLPVMSFVTRVCCITFPWLRIFCVSTSTFFDESPIGSTAEVQRTTSLNLGCSQC